MAKRASAVAAQAHALAAREPDVVALQEVTARSWPLWRAALEVIGLPHATCSLADADPARQPAARRRGGVLIAARGPLSPAGPLPVPRPESTAAASVAGIEVHTAHVPNAANGWVKPDTLRALRTGLEARGGPAVLCGDLNTPRREHPDGTVISFARDSRERLREERGTEWDEGELGVVPGLAELGWTDCFRALHGYAAKEPSWTYPRGGGGYRLDHVFCSPDLVPRACAYHHDWREAGLSDHSALEADLDPSGKRTRTVRVFDVAAFRSVLPAKVAVTFRAPRRVRRDSSSSSPSGRRRGRPPSWRRR